MTTDTYNKIAAHVDQCIAFEWNTFGLRIVILADAKETINEIVAIARGAGHKVKKNIHGKGDPDAEAHLMIR